MAGTMAWQQWHGRKWAAAVVVWVGGVAMVPA